MKEDLCEMVNYVFECGELSESQKDGVVTLIFKKGDPTEIKNYRPITLLNVDYKIIAKLLACRLKGVVRSVVGESLVCAVPGRSVWENLILVRDVVSDVWDRKCGVALLSFDFEKAYDRVSHEFMFLVLERMNFPREFVCMVKVLYKNVFSRVLVNGALTEKININSGVRQGCPLSPLLFICCIEPLVVSLCGEKIIRGVTIPGSGGREAKVLSYMDDVVVVCKDVRSVKRAVLVAECFCSVSGFKINLEKSVCCGFGNWSASESLKVNVIKEQIKILGVVFDQRNNGVKCWEGILDKVKKKVAFWKFRKLTFTGKILIIKAIILPLLLYTGLVYYPGEVVMKRIIRELFMFVWGAKMERVKREVLCKDVNKGGRGMPDVRLFLSVRYLGMIVRMSGNETLTGCMVRYSGGKILRWYKWVSGRLNVPYTECLSDQNFV